MALGTFAAGYYFATIDPPGPVGPTSLGLTETGWRVTWEFLEETLRRSDRYGGSTIEAFSTGCNVNLECVFLEYRLGSMLAVNPMNAFAAGVGAQNFTFPIVGQAATNLASTIVLTAQLGSLAATSGPASVTFPQVKASQRTVEMMLGPTNRTLPFNGVVYLQDDGGVQKYFSAT